MAGRRTGLWFRGALSSHPDLDQGFKRGGSPMSQCMCVHIHMCVWGVTWSEGTTSFHLLSPASSYAHRVARVAVNGRCWLRGGPPCALPALPPLVSFPPPNLSVSCPSPVPFFQSHLSSTATRLPRSSLSSLCAHPVFPAFFVTSFGPLSPVLWHPRVSLAAALWGPS